MLRISGIYIYIHILYEMNIICYLVSTRPQPQDIILLRPGQSLLEQWNRLIFIYQYIGILIHWYLKI